MTSSWICAQIGAREHFAVPRALHLSGRLDSVLTDVWLRPGNWLGALQKNLRGRYHPDLAAARVKSWNAQLLAFELVEKARKRPPWTVIMNRNRWFQRRVVRELESRPTVENSRTTVFFSYSYAALEPLRLARKRGWTTVLGQIDPGPVEERLVGELHRLNGMLGSRWTPAPDEYWRLWREECALADHIVVNSGWSRSALIEEGIAAEKIAVIPLAYQAPAASVDFNRNYPSAFTRERPLRVLFLGQVNLRKGMAEVVESIRFLRDRPIEFTIVGPLQIEPPDDLRASAKVRWVGAAPRNSVADYFREADVFLFPTHSDGFGLTQLEAQAWKLPLIASTSCGTVVKHGQNGWLLPEVTAEAISRQLAACASDPSLLASAAVESGLAADYTLSSVGSAFFRLA